MPAARASRRVAELLVSATPDAAQQKDIDFAFGGTTLRERALCPAHFGGGPAIWCRRGLDRDDEIFGVLVRDFNTHAVELHGRSATTAEQARFAMRMVRRPVHDPARYDQDLKDHACAQRRISNGTIVRRVEIDKGRVAHCTSRAGVNLDASLGP